jgi:16S rRNA (uracil1498-N3)-methyltransferase
VTRFHVDVDAAVGEAVRFDSDEARHLARVLRLGEGDIVLAVDGRGHELTVRLATVGPRGAEGVVVSRTARRTESPIALTLVQGIVKGDKLDGIVRMATELGAHRIDLIVTERTIAGAEPDRWAHRLVRWRRVAKEAAKQCGRAVLPEIAPPRSLDGWLTERNPADLLVCFWEREEAPLDAVLPTAGVERVSVVVGPEGGLSDAEVDRLRAAGALVAGLGPRVLRAETAGPVALALLQARYGDMGAPR